MKNLSKSLAECIDACNTCAIACIEMESNSMAKCIKTDLVCAEVCSTLLQLTQYQHENIKGLISYCITVCEECKKECEKHDHQHCQKCAEACANCIKVCEDYLLKN